MKYIIPFVAFLICGTLTAQDPLSGKVTSVFDGNTIEVTTAANETYKIVLVGVDCPELSQEFGEKAKKFLERALANKQVEVQLKGKDRWGNYLAIVLVKGDDPRVDLVKEGLAWTSERNPDPELEAHRVQAQEKKKGLWKEENPTPPWIFRRQQTMLEAKSS